tara:strand:+ start:1644 stop:1805 length:162 start_codon:yes stop_codon:yes gene_type:complete
MFVAIWTTAIALALTVFAIDPGLFAAVFAVAVCVYAWISTRLWDAVTEWKVSR